jgi:hypothetical protein
MARWRQRVPVLVPSLLFARVAPQSSEEVRTFERVPRGFRSGPREELCLKVDYDGSFGVVIHRDRVLKPFLRPGSAGDGKNWLRAALGP